MKFPSMKICLIILLIQDFVSKEKVFQNYENALPEILKGSVLFVIIEKLIAVVSLSSLDNTILLFQT